MLPMIQDSPEIDIIITIIICGFLSAFRRWAGSLCHNRFLPCNFHRFSLIKS